MGYRRTSTDNEGARWGVSLRELATELGLPNLWRRWLLEDFKEAVYRHVGRPDLRVSVVRGCHANGEPLPTWALHVCAQEKRVGIRRLIWTETGETLWPRARGQGALPCAIVLLNALLDAQGHPCEAMAATSTRLLVEGHVTLLEAP